MLFELPEPTQATITSVTPRSEKHGDEDAPAISFGVKITAPNTILDRLSAGLMSVFYKAAEEPDPQPEFDETQVVHLPLLRTGVLETVHLKGRLEGWTVHMEYGIDEGSAVVFGGCKIDEFRLALSEGGSVELRFRVGTSDVNELSLGRLGMSLKAEVSLQITAPKVAAVEAPQQGELIDASRDGDFPFGGETQGDESETDLHKTGAELPAGGTKLAEAGVELHKAETNGDDMKDARSWAKAVKREVVKLTDGSTAELTTTTTAEVLPMGTPRTKRGRDATQAFIAAHGATGEVAP